MIKSGLFFRPSRSVRHGSRQFLEACKKFFLQSFRQNSTTICWKRSKLDGIQVWTANSYYFWSNLNLNQKFSKRGFYWFRPSHYFGASRNLILPQFNVRMGQGMKKKFWFTRWAIKIISVIAQFNRIFKNRCKFRPSREKHSSIMSI